MRKILFRGKRIGNGEWFYGVAFPLDNCGKVTLFRQNQGDGALEGVEVLPETVGQYTGLTDKNGKKIFEGDIIKIVPDYDYSDDYSISKVYSYNGVFCVDYHGDDFDSTALGFLDDYLPDGDFEVIGNIHDNPELLEVTK